MRQRLLFPCSLLLIILVITGCPSTEEFAPRPEPALENEPCANIEGAVQDWISENAEELSQRIGAIVTANLPVARDIAAKVIEEALVTRLQSSIDFAEPIAGTNKCSARVTLAFPLQLSVPLVGEIEYQVSVQYDLTIEDENVTDADIDLSSFQMTSAPR